MGVGFFDHLLTTNPPIKRGSSHKPLLAVLSLAGERHSRDETLTVKALAVAGQSPEHRGEMEPRVFYSSSESLG